MKTDVSVSVRNRVTTGVVYNARYKSYVAVGRMVDFLRRSRGVSSNGRDEAGHTSGRIADFIRRSHAFYDVYRSAENVSGRSRLSTADIERFAVGEQRVVDEEYTEVVSAYTMSEESFRNGQTRHQQVAAKVADLLADGEIHSVVNIGARIDIVSAFLAKKFPHILFTSVDIFPDLEARNERFGLAPNWDFKVGYALDLLEQGAIGADIAVFISTSVCFTNRELHAYAKALAQRARIVVVNEPWWPSVSLTAWAPVLRPENIDPHRSRIGGEYNYYLHNYPEIFEMAGFNIVESRLTDRIETDSWKMKGYRYEMVAEKR